VPVAFRAPSGSGCKLGPRRGAQAMENPNHGGSETQRKKPSRWFCEGQGPCLAHQVRLSCATRSVKLAKFEWHRKSTTSKNGITGGFKEPLEMVRDIRMKVAITDLNLLITECIRPKVERKYEGGGPGPLCQMPCNVAGIFFTGMTQRIEEGLTRLIRRARRVQTRSHAIAEWLVKQQEFTVKPFKGISRARICLSRSRFVGH
jgi:hypothetical protein